METAVSSAMDSMFKRIIACYQREKSIKATAKKMECSEQTVRRVLITAGIYTSPTAKRIIELSNLGMPIEDIAEFLHMSKSAVNGYIPYTRGCRADWPTTQNAIQIRKCRERKKAAKDSQNEKNRGPT